MQFTDELDNQFLEDAAFSDRWLVASLSPDEGFFHPRAFNEHLWATSLHSALCLSAVALYSVQCLSVAALFSACLCSAPLHTRYLYTYNAYNDSSVWYDVSMQWYNNTISQCQYLYQYQCKYQYKVHQVQQVEVDKLLKVVLWEISIELFLNKRVQKSSKATYGSKIPGIERGVKCVLGRKVDEL